MFRWPQETNTYFKQISKVRKHEFNGCIPFHRWPAPREEQSRQGKAPVQECTGLTMRLCEKFHNRHKKEGERKDIRQIFIIVNGGLKSVEPLLCARHHKRCFTSFAVTNNSKRWVLLSRFMEKESEAQIIK